MRANWFGAARLLQARGGPPDTEQYRIGLAQLFGEDRVELIHDREALLR
jgi:hypothetical protein